MELHKQSFLHKLPIIGAFRNVSSYQVCDSIFGLRCFNLASRIAGYLGVK